MKPRRTQADYSDDFYKRVYSKYNDEPDYDVWRNAGATHNEAMRAVKLGWQNYPDYYSVYAGQLPEVVITPDKNTRNDVLLTTYYPGVSKYWATGHSTLDTPGGNFVDVKSDDPGYNLLLNNCSDATRYALEQATGKKINPLFFTTPGDVRSFAEDVLGGKSVDMGDGSVQTTINLPQYQINKIARYGQELMNKIRLYARKRAEQRRSKLIAKGPYKYTEQ